MNKTKAVAVLQMLLEDDAARRNMAVTSVFRQQERSPLKFSDEDEQHVEN